MLPRYWTGLNTAGTEHDAWIGVRSSPCDTYSIFPFLISVSASVTGIFRQSKLFSGMYFRSTSRNPSNDSRPVHVHASFTDLKKLVDCINSRISSGEYP